MALGDWRRWREWEENPKSNSIWVAGSESKALSKAQR